MLDFIIVSARSEKKGVIEIYPKFIAKSSKDLMIRGGDFYAIWNEETKLWSTDEEVALYLIDKELKQYYDAHNKDFGEDHVKVSYLWDVETGMVDRWHKYCQKQMWDNYQPLDEKLIFANTELSKTDYASKKLPYPLENSPTPSYNELIGTLYSPEERHKIEWAVGSIVSGESVKLQKFLVMYGSAGTGKSTVLNIIQDLFDGYCGVFDAKSLGSATNIFALEAFKSNPLVAIQHDGDLSRIEDNTRLNSVVSHELMTVNEKFKSTYSSRFNAFLFMGTNRPVKITDAKSGILRRLIDVSPSGKKVPQARYKDLVARIKFELGGIAYHCKEVYLEDPSAYDDYIPVSMLGASNDFYNFMLDSFDVFKREDGTTLKAAWEMYNEYVKEARLDYPYSQRKFKEELKNYFRNFEERVWVNNETRVRNYYSGFIFDKFTYHEPEEQSKENTLVLDSTISIFDKECSGYLAQYATPNETPYKPWSDVKTTLSAINTGKLHFVKVPENHIVIDFDIKDSNGEKSLEKNLKAAAKLPPTYAELSKSGKGVHLHYIYTGDPDKLSRVYDNEIEIKVYTGNSSLRRKLTKCNKLPIATISSGLPLKEETKMLNEKSFKSEKGMRALITRNLKKEIHPGTKPSVDFIFQILEDAYAGDLRYDVSDMRPDILAFAMGSTHHAEYCVKLVGRMKFKSEEPAENTEDYIHDEIVFYDVEVFPNLFLVNWKFKGADNKVNRMINPSPAEIEGLIKHKLVGFNCRRYDNHIMYARLLGYDNMQLYLQSQRIIQGKPGAFFSDAYNLSYTDVYDFASSGNKKSLKKFEIELGIHHHELGLPWDQPVPEERWKEVAEYCDDDVLATEAVFEHLSGDWTARQILAKLSGLTVNDTTNAHTTRIIFGSEKNPQSEFNYRNMGEEKPGYSRTVEGCDPNYTVFDPETNEPIFPGYEFKLGKSTYRGEEVGEGGYVYAEPGIYFNVALLDVASMHPHSIISENLFGDRYTKRFKELVDARIAIKHEDYDTAKTMLDGKLAEFLGGEFTSKELANALKTAINSVYGLTAAKFEHPFHDPRNKDNIVAKRGALFMINLKHEVQQRGFTVAHIKTDSIKIPNATPEIIDFVMRYGREYGYTFEHEATYKKMCLVNDAVYIAQYMNAQEAEKLYGYIPEKNNKKSGTWDATGTQFAVPYVFKTLFSKEHIAFEDMCETKSVSSSLYLDMNEALPSVEAEEKELERLNKKAATFADGSDEKNDILMRIESLKTDISKGHDYHFVGKVGSFCPILPGCGGGLLMREKDGKYYAATGSKGYRWLEAEMVRDMGKDDIIDRKYYISMVDEAVKTMSQYKGFDGFLPE